MICLKRSLFFISLRIACCISVLYSFNCLISGFRFFVCFFDVFKVLKEKHPDLKLLHASRHLTRLNDIKALLDSRNMRYGFRSKNDSFAEYDIILLDTLGELAKMYSYAHFAFIGGSFNTTGGHNPLEASIWNKPVISGPDTHNFKDIYKLLMTFRAGFVVQTPKDCVDVADIL